MKDETQALSLCTFCGRDVYNRCIHQSQVKWCNQKTILSASEVYGRYETNTDGVLVERGIGPVDVLPDAVFTPDQVLFTNGATTTKVWLSGLSVNQ